MSKKNIAVLTGGYSSEAIVAVKSAQTIMDSLSSEMYQKYLIFILKDEWYCQLNDTKYPINKDDFSIQIDDKKVVFDCVYITIHGTPGEDGKLQGYFDMIQLPYTSASQQASTITFNKWMTNQILIQNGFHCAKSVLLMHKNSFNEDEIVEKLGVPCFVKPNGGGSSFGISKVSKKSELTKAIKIAFSEGEQVIIESQLVGKEVTCGAYQFKNQIHALPITEIVSHNEYFDYDAKYNGLSDEITPARISDENTKKIQETTIEVYKLFKLSGIIRVDYILIDNTPHIIEVNITPGMSQQSLIPQQVAHAKDINLTDLLGNMVEEAIEKKKHYFKQI